MGAVHWSRYATGVRSSDDGFRVARTLALRAKFCVGDPAAWVLRLVHHQRDSEAKEIAA